MIVPVLNMLQKVMPKLTNDQLRNCLADAMSMEAKPGNGIREYRKAVVTERERRLEEKNHASNES